MKGRDTFTMDVIKELYQLFLQKDNADYNEQKSIRRKIREKGFYISAPHTPSWHRSTGIPWRRSHGGRGWWRWGTSGAGCRAAQRSGSLRLGHLADGASGRCWRR